MSDPVPSMLGNSLPTDANPGATNPLNPSTTQQSPDGEAFPQLFASFDPESTAVDEMAMSALMHLENPFSPLPVLAGTDQVSTVTLSTGQTGNSLPLNLPTMSINGFIAQSDPNGAAAVSFVGDGQHLLATTPQLTSGLAPAIQQSQTQLHEGIQQSLQPSGLILKDIVLANHNSVDVGKQTDILTEMLPQSNLTDEQAVPKTTTSTGFTQLLSTPMAMLENSTAVAASARSLEPMTTTLQQPHWNKQIGDRLNVMISRGLQQAEIRLNPPELGMLEVKVQLQGEQANVTFSTPHSQVKEALDAAIPRLREMLEENGLTLGDVNVSHQSLAQGQSQSGEEADSRSSAHSSSADGEHEMSETGDENKSSNNIVEIGMLDVFA